ncbi:MAG: DUF2752 domain-containing protein [Bacteroidota bacterium]|jgi:hypothetical protein
MNKIILAVLTIVITAFYFFWNPSKISFLPLCPFKNFTGFYCPGCGGQRAFHDILHGNFIAAFHANLLIYLFLPMAILKLFDELTDTTLSANLVLKKNGIGLFLTCLIVFTILRNIPEYPFNQLIP